MGVWMPSSISTVVVLLGGYVGISLYKDLKAGDPDPLAERLGFIFTILQNKYYVDELYHWLIINPVVQLATLCAKFDYDWVINPIVDFFGKFTMVVADGAGVFDVKAVDGYFVNGIPGLFRSFGGQLRLLQTGRVQNYLLILVIGLLILVGLSLLVWSGQVPSVAAMAGP